MNATTQLQQSAIEHAEALFKAMPVPQSETATDAFGALIDAHLIRPEHFAALCHRYHGYMVDHLPNVLTWLEPKQELEAVGDALITAINSATTDEEDFPEANAFSRY